MKLVSQVRNSLKAWCSRDLCWIVHFWCRSYHESNTSAINFRVDEVIHWFIVDCEYWELWGSHQGASEDLDALRSSKIISKPYGVTFQKAWILSSRITVQSSVVIVVKRMRVEWSDFRIPKDEVILLFFENFCVGFKDQTSLHPMGTGDCCPGEETAF
jgi:hypothetical protein